MRDIVTRWSISFMLHLARKFGPLGWNLRPLGEDDFFRICRRERIKVEEMPLSVRGFYGVCKGKRFIALDSKMRGVARLFCMFHELGHHYLHAPKSTNSVNYFHLREEPKVKFEADAFAIIALIPQGLLKELMESEDYDEDNGLPSELLKERAELFARYGI